MAAFTSCLPKPSVPIKWGAGLRPDGCAKASANDCQPLQWFAGCGSIPLQGPMSSKVLASCKPVIPMETQSFQVTFERVYTTTIFVNAESLDEAIKQAEEQLAEKELMQMDVDTISVSASKTD